MHTDEWVVVFIVLMVLLCFISANWALILLGIALLLACFEELIKLIITDITGHVFASQWYYLQDENDSENHLIRGEN